MNIQNFSYATKTISSNLKIPKNHLQVIESIRNRVCADAKKHKEIRNVYENNKAFFIDSIVIGGNFEDAARAQLEKLLTPVNYCKPAAKCFASLVTGGSITRELESELNLDDVKEIIGSAEYQLVVNKWVLNAVLFGTAVIVPRFHDGEIDFWAPDPLNTKIICDPFNPKKIIAVAEVNCDSIQILHKDFEYKQIGDEVIYLKNSIGDEIPCAIGYGDDNTCSGQVYGKSLVYEAVDYSKRATATLYNISLMQKNLCGSTLVKTIDLEKVSQDIEMTGVGNIGQVSNASLTLPIGSDAKYITPNADLDGSIKVLQELPAHAAASMGIPVDVLNSAITLASGGSAEAARTRMLPLVQQSKNLINAWKTYEIKLINSIISVVLSTPQKAISISEVKKSVKVVINNKISVLPHNTNEITQDIIGKVTARLMPVADGIRILNPQLNDDQISKQAELWKIFMESTDSTKVGDSALKLSQATQVA